MSSDSILRSPHDKEHPYVMILRQLVRDNSVSPNCRFMMVHLLSNKDGWEIKVKQLINEFSKWNGWSRDSIYSYINEAIKAGYIQREEYRHKGLKAYRYYLSEDPKNQKKFTFTEPAYTLGSDTKERQKKRQERISLKNGNSKLTPQEQKPLPSLDQNDPIVFSLADGKFPDGTELSLRTRRALAKYQGKDRERLEANIRYFNRQIATGKKPKMSYERWLQDCVNKNYAAKELFNVQNDLYAKFIKEMHNLSNQEFYIMSSIVKINNDSIDKRLPPDTFKQILENFVKNRR